MTISVPDLYSELRHGVRVWQSSDAPRQVFALAGPPASALLFRHLARPLASAGVALVAPELFHPAPADGRIETLVERLGPLVAPGATILVHGLALPVGLRLLSRVAARRLVVLDGPLAGLDPITAGLARLAKAAPGVLSRTLLQEDVWRRWMASSVALRRLVVNPYVMDRDIVAMLSAPLTASPAHRRAVADFLGELVGLGPPWPDPGVPVLLGWGASNDIYPIPPDPEALLCGANVTAVTIPGGKHFHIEERPWDLAEQLIAWLEKPPSTVTVT